MMHRTSIALGGFTLIETFVAITILLTAIVGPLTIASRGLSSAFLAKEQTTAAFLAQEAIEYVRYKRDSNTLGSAQWLTGLTACMNANDSCTIDVVQDRIRACGGTCPPLRYDAQSGFYTYDAGDPTTNYTRAVKVISITSAEARIEVTVTWLSQGRSRSFVAAENIFDWQ